MNGSGPGPLTLGQLTVASGLDFLNVNSTGSASDNVITNVSTVHDSVNITGGTHLTFGSAADPYTFTDPSSLAGGVIDAHTDTGGVTTWLNAGPTATGNPAQTFIGGPGSATVNVENIGGAVVGFALTGSDTVAFQTANVNSSFTTTDPTHQYNQVPVWTPANDTLNIHNSATFGGGVLTNTNSAVPVAAGDQTNTFHYSTGTIAADATINAFNYIKIDTAVAPAAGVSVQTAFADAMGLAGDIIVSGTHAHVLSFYNSTTSEAAVVSVNSSPGVIFEGDHVNVIGLVHMTQAAYADFTPHFA